MQKENLTVAIPNDEIEQVLNGSASSKSQTRNLRRVSSPLPYAEFKTKFNQSRTIKFRKSNKEGMLVGSAEQPVNNKMLYIDVWRDANLGAEAEKEVTLYIDDKGAYVAFVQEAKEVVVEE